MAFYNTKLKTVTINGEVTYVKSSTFSSKNLTEVIILEGCYKIADYAFRNDNGDPIIYTVPRSVSNFGINVFRDVDTVRCYHNSIAEAAAKTAECNIEYIDDDKLKGSKTIAKATMMGLDIPKLIGDTITKIYSAEDVPYEYELDETGLFNIELTQPVLDFLGIESRATTSDESPKFKVLLDHYRKSSPAYGFGLSSKILKLKDTISITNTKIFDDGVSRVLELTYNDHKYESKKAKLIILMTGNRVRYCCLNNRNTNVYCKMTYSKDLSKLLDALIPGDTIGYSCVIAGKKYDNIAGKGDVKKDGQTLAVNIYQALFNCSISVKLDRNHLALILPANGKVLKCASLGKAVWANENEESYKNRYCVVEEIQDLENNTIFEYGVNSPARDDALFTEPIKLTDAQVEARIEDYSKIGEAKLSPYVQFRNYCIVERINRLEDLDLRGFGILLNLPIIEQRTTDWFDKSVSKTIVPDVRHEIELSDGSTIYQYKTAKRVAMRNKLITGGDRTIFIYEVYDKFNNRRGIFASMYDAESLFALAMSMNKMSRNKEKIFLDQDKLDVVNDTDFILIAQAFVNAQDADNGFAKNSSIWLSVYKPNGLYYLTYVGRNRSGVKKAVPLVQVGEFDVVLDYIDCAITTSASGYDLLHSAGYRAIYSNSYVNMGFSYRGKSKTEEEFEKFLEVRKLAMSGEKDIQPYLDTGAPPVICHMFGVHSFDDSIYDIPEPKEDPEDFEVDFGDKDTNNDEPEIDISDEDFELDLEEDDEDKSIMEALRIQQLLNKTE